jgi:hypothetical protein
MNNNATTPKVHMSHFRGSVHRDAISLHVAQEEEKRVAKVCWTFI